MVDSRRPVLQLFDQLFAEEQQVQNIGLENLKTYLEQGGSIFPLVEKGVQGLVREQRVTPDDARRFLRSANSMATFLRRQFIEQTLTGDKTTATRSSSGLLSMVIGPNYEFLIGTHFAALCPPNALESLLSPVAYLIELLRWIRDRIESVDNPPAEFRLHNRRTDLLPLSVDFNAVYQSISSVDIIVAVLEAFIAENTDDENNTSIEDALIEARYPNGLPYYQHWVTLDGIAQSHGLSVGDFEHRVDLTYPYFLQANARGPNTGPGFAHASRLGPYQRELLTEPRAGFGDAYAFYASNFGTSGVEHLNLNQFAFFGERTKLTSPQIEALLSIRDFAPVRSANVTYPDEAPEIPESERSGSVYINNNTSPPVRIDDGSLLLPRLTADPNDAEGFNRYDRMNQMVRLANWVGLPFDEVDAVLVAAIKAVELGNAPSPTKEMNISSGVVRALGLFQTLRERYECTAADFAVFIDELGVYGRGDALSPFDRIFNNQAGYREPLKLDNGEFLLAPVPGEVDLTISQLCSGLAIDLQTYYYLAMTVANAHGLTEKLTRSPAIISAFYRLVRLPRLLNITPVEGVLMLSLLGEDSWVKGVAGVPYIHTVPDGPPDVLELIEAMQSCVQWCAQSNLPVLWVLQHAVAAQPALEPTEQDLQFFEQLRNLLPTTLLSNSAFLMAGVPPAGAANWLEFLATLADGLNPIVDANGLVLPYVGTAEQYLAVVHAKIAWAVDSALGVIEPLLRQNIIDIMTRVLLQVRDAQTSLVKETLAVYASVGVEQAIPILNWANSTVHQLLQQVLELTDASSEQPDRTRIRNANLILDLLAEVRRRSEVVTTLGLSAAVLLDYLDYGYRDWFAPTNKHELSLRTLYYLTTLTRAFSLSEQPAQKLLDYLRQVNALPTVTGHALKLAQQAAAIKLADFFGWSVQEVRECVSRIDPTDLKVLKNLSQLDLLMRIRVLSTESGMDALTIFLIGSLPETVDKQAYEEAAELALLGESRTRAPTVHVPGDLKALVTTTCVVLGNNDVVANKPGEHITYKVTLRDAKGAALSGVNVYWQATLGRIETGATQIDGTLLAEFIPGKVMGTDTPIFWLDLFDPEYAPPLVVAFEVQSLSFPGAELSPTPSGDVPQGQEVELYAVLEDGYENRAGNSLVDWYAESLPPTKFAVATIRPSQGFTDQQGLTRVFVSSSTGGTFVFKVRSQAGDAQRTFVDPITFVGGSTPG
ncbi:virulence plasmid 28 protein [Pseudomonas sp. N40(2020)]|uniref:Tc toxin subunit A n=1 Tax=Pseudomonas sp. N40(2020) TaxID=2767798 RepID=UPI001656F695|nr:Tc toxin subunit A [Pseudomonas sp. N40(2020)]MBC8996615.1 virulence plasmid 28 protein [Pseudomonas sp. N40(2020)]